MTPAAIPTTNSTATTVPLPQPGATYVFQVQALGPNGVPLGISNTTAPLGSSGVPGIPPPVGPGGPGIVNLGTSSVSVQSQIASLAGGTILTVIARDIGAIPVVNATVAVSPLRPGDLASPMQPVTDPTGPATFQLRGVTPGPGSFTVTVNGVPLQPVNVTFQ
jgi:hypothetical protein